jgi:alkylation response protein AidB-like acyl-CoA dehydrogenase
MRLDLSGEALFFQETVRRFVEGETPIATVRKRIGEGGRFDRGWWRRAAGLGATSLLVPEALGGGTVSGRGPVDLAVVAEEFGRAVVPSPLAPANVVAATLARRATDHLAPIVAGLLDGSVVATWARRDAPDDPVTCRRTGDGFVISGRRVAVEAADQADYFLIDTTTPDSPVQLVVPSDAPGVAVDPSSSLDLLRSFATVRFDDVVVAPDASVGDPVDVADDVEWQRLLYALVLSAEAAGAAARVLEFSLEYAFDRYSFGRPLASYQALKHRFADMKLWLEACHAIVDDAAMALAEQGIASARWVHAAKAYVGDRSVELIQDCVQIHGGIGVTWEHDIHLYLRRATSNRAIAGTPAEHRRQLAVAMGA